MAEEAASWGDLLQAHVQRRTQLQWTPEQQEPVKYVTQYEVSRRERSFDPVLQRFREPQVEQQRAQAETLERTRKLNKSKVAQLDKTQHFDVINHAPALPGIEAVGQPARRGGSSSGSGSGSGSGTSTSKQSTAQRGRTNYNIISNVDYAEHHYGPPDTRPAPSETAAVAKARLERKQSHSDFDIISNRYKERHEDKVAVDKRVEKQSAARKYWETHDFNPVVCTYYEPDKEERFQAQLKEVQRSHGKDFSKGLPPCVKDSEGMKSNIITMAPKAQASGRDEGASDPAVAKRASKASKPFETQQQQRGVAARQIRDTRNFNRHNPDRHRDMHGFKHGFDIVSTHPFVGRNSVPKAPIRLPPKKSLWQKIETLQRAHEERLGSG